jgi:hypothetical protein
VSLDQVATQESYEPDRCPLCGQPNDCQLCGTDVYNGACWCAGVSIPEELLARVPPNLRNRACICQSCVRWFWREQAKREPKPVRAGEFYFDDAGLMVFTAAYHLRRGYCCGSGCRHCPYPSLGKSTEDHGPDA